MQWTSFKFSCFLRVHADDGSTAVAVFRVVLLTLAFLVNVISGQYFKEMSSRRAARTQGLAAQIWWVKVEVTVTSQVCDLDL